jgi:hypothetical protein
MLHVRGGDKPLAENVLHAWSAVTCSPLPVGPRSRVAWLSMTLTPDIEWVYLIWNTWVLLVVLVLVGRFRANRWLWLMLLVSGWHGVEHVAIFRVYLTTGLSGTPGLLSQGGAIAGGLLVSRPDLHFFYNLIETIPLASACSRSRTGPDLESLHHAT